MSKEEDLNSSKPMKNQVKRRFYVFLIMVILILIATISFVRANYHLNVNMVEVDVEALVFEPIEEVTQWHNREARFVYLTFNDGPSDNSEKIMDILSQHQIQGTFFVLGSAVNNHPNSEDILRRMVEEGHYIGLHSMTRDIHHLYRDENAAQNFLDEMLELQSLVRQKTGGFESSLCRAPMGTSGHLSDNHLELIINSQLNCWDWHIDARDWGPVTVDNIMESIEFGMMLWRNPNDVVLLFQESDVAIEALPKVINYYLELGYEFLPYHPLRHFPVNFINHPDL